MATVTSSHDYRQTEKPRMPLTGSDILCSPRPPIPAKISPFFEQLPHALARFGYRNIFYSKIYFISFEMARRIVALK